MINYYDQETALVVVVSKALRPEACSSKAYMVVSLQSDKFADDNTLIVKSKGYNSFKDYITSDYQGSMDKNDPHNLERCIRLAIKLLQQIL